MKLQWQVWLYQRPFRRPLHTSHGRWEVREGLLVQLIDAIGNWGLGEIAPLPWFGSETLVQACEFCQQLPLQLSPETIAAIPDHLPACQFGFETALESLQGVAASLPDPPLCGLLPAGATALTTWKDLWQQGYRTFKWKLVGSQPEQLRLLEALVQALPPAAQLRLDANGGLDWLAACTWLELSDRLGIEFLEQPLPPQQFEAMQELSQRYTTPLALDESVATLTQLQACYDQGWRGIYIIKPAIAGFPSRLRQFCRENAIAAVFSSVFETNIGWQAGLRLAGELGSQWACGYGTRHWLDEKDLELTRLSHG